MPSRIRVAQLVTNPHSSSIGLRQMGFWHTSQIEKHEEKIWPGYEINYNSSPIPATIKCEVCGAEFTRDDDYRVHLFTGHTSTRPQLFLRGRECGRSRQQIIAITQPSDWDVKNAIKIHINGHRVGKSQVGKYLSEQPNGTVSVVLTGESGSQDFEFSFTVADENELQIVDDALLTLIENKSLTLASIDEFLQHTRRASTARLYRDGLANYFYGVLARERSPESGLNKIDEAGRPYLRKYDEAVSQLSLFDRPPAEAICGLVAFHYNQLHVAIRKTRSPRVARASLRLARLTTGTSAPNGDTIRDNWSFDHDLSDKETEFVLQMCSLPLDGSAVDAVSAFEDTILSFQPSDQLKLHVVAGEHYLAQGNFEMVRFHVGAVRHSVFAELWVKSILDRTRGIIE